MDVKWQNNREFLDWLIVMGYARETDKGPKHDLSLGTILYMYEAWCASWIQVAAKFHVTP